MLTWLLYLGFVLLVVWAITLGCRTHSWPHLSFSIDFTVAIWNLVEADTYTCGSGGRFSLFSISRREPWRLSCHRVSEHIGAAGWLWVPCPAKNTERGPLVPRLGQDLLALSPVSSPRHYSRPPLCKWVSGRCPYIGWAMRPTSRGITRLHVSPFSLLC